LHHAGSQWALVPKDDSKVSDDFKITGITFTKSARELLPIVDVIPNEEYNKALAAWFDDRGITFTNLVRA
jgi:hypothetical protein